MRRCCRVIIERTLRETDTPEQVYRKAIWMPILVVTYPLVPVFFILGYDYITRAEVIGHIIVFCALSVGALYPLVRRSLPLRVLGNIFIALGFGFIFQDITAAAEMVSFRPWMFVVLVMDLCLTFNVDNYTQLFIIGLSSVWGVVYTIEDSYRLGLYDIDRFSEPSGRRDVCGCAAPPCALGLGGLFFAFPTVTVLCGDYFATRGFATGLRAEQGRVQAAVEVAEQVASSLAGFDLEAAESVMTQAGAELPLPLAGSFRRLLRNLARYRPYLPQSCFEEDDGSEGGSEERSGTEGGASNVHSQRRASRSAQRLHERDPEPHQQSGRVSMPGMRQRFVHGMDSVTSANACSESCASDTQVALLARPGAHAPQVRRVTLLAQNRSGLLAAPLDADLASSWLAEEVDHFLAAVKTQGGVADVLSGDHFSASFGAVKAQGSQCLAAVRVACSKAGSFRAGSWVSELQALPRTGAVCSGRALCGDFGSSACQRFMVIGGVSAFLPAAERAAAAWGIGTLIDSDVQSDAEQFWTCRLLKCVKFPKLKSRDIGLWELREARLSAGPADEWMYELESARANPWDLYNAVIRKWCQGEDALQALNATGAPSGGEVAAALHAVRELVQEGAPPPVGDFSAGVFAGDTAPLVPREHAPS